MATLKSFTDIPQSKKLAEILPLESADYCFGIDNKTLHYNSSPYPCAWKDYTCKEYYIPCWSLAALLKVLPDTITSNDGIAFKLNIKKNIIEYSNPSLYLIYKASIADNIIDACYEMIIKLHELKML